MEVSIPVSEITVVHNITNSPVVISEHDMASSLASVKDKLCNKLEHQETKSDTLRSPSLQRSCTTYSIAALCEMSQDKQQKQSNEERQEGCKVTSPKEIIPQVPVCSSNQQAVTDKELVKNSTTHEVSKTQYSFIHTSTTTSPGDSTRSHVPAISQGLSSDRGPLIHQQSSAVGNGANKIPTQTGDQGPLIHKLSTVGNGAMKTPMHPSDQGLLIQHQSMAAGNEAMDTIYTSDHGPLIQYQTSTVGNGTIKMPAHTNDQRALIHQQSSSVENGSNKIPAHTNDQGPLIHQQTSVVGNGSSKTPIHASDQVPLIHQQTSAVRNRASKIPIHTSDQVPLIQHQSVTVGNGAIKTLTPSSDQGPLTYHQSSAVGNALIKTPMNTSDQVPLIHQSSASGNGAIKTNTVHSGDRVPLLTQKSSAILGNSIPKTSIILNNQNNLCTIQNPKHSNSHGPSNTQNPNPSINQETLSTKYSNPNQDHTTDNALVNKKLVKNHTAAINQDCDKYLISSELSKYPNISVNQEGSKYTNNSVIPESAKYPILSDNRDSTKYRNLSDTQESTKYPNLSDNQEPIKYPNASNIYLNSSNNQEPSKYSSLSGKPEPVKYQEPLTSQNSVSSINQDSLNIQVISTIHGLSSNEPSLINDGQSTIQELSNTHGHIINQDSSTAKYPNHTNQDPLIAQNPQPSVRHGPSNRRDLVTKERSSDKAVDKQAGTSPQFLSNDKIFRTHQFLTQVSQANPTQSLEKPNIFSNFQTDTTLLGNSSICNTNLEHSSLPITSTSMDHIASPITNLEHNMFGGNPLDPCFLDMSEDGRTSTNVNLPLILSVSTNFGDVLHLPSPKSVEAVSPTAIFLSTFPIVSSSVTRPSEGGTELVVDQVNHPHDSFMEHTLLALEGHKDSQNRYDIGMWDYEIPGRRSMKKNQWGSKDSEGYQHYYPTNTFKTQDKNSYHVDQSNALESDHTHRYTSNASESDRNRNTFLIQTMLPPANNTPQNQQTHIQPYHGNMTSSQNIVQSTNRNTWDVLKDSSIQQNQATTQNKSCPTNRLDHHIINHQSNFSTSQSNQTFLEETIPNKDLTWTKHSHYSGKMMTSRTNLASSYLGQPILSKRNTNNLNQWPSNKSASNLNRNSHKSKVPVNWMTSTQQPSKTVGNIAPTLPVSSSSMVFTTTASNPTNVNSVSLCSSTSNLTSTSVNDVVPIRPVNFPLKHNFNQACHTKSPVSKLPPAFPAIDNFPTQFLHEQNIGLDNMCLQVQKPPLQWPPANFLSPKTMSEEHLCQPTNVESFLTPSKPAENLIQYNSDNIHMQNSTQTYYNKPRNVHSKSKNQKPKSHRNNICSNSSTLFSVSQLVDNSSNNIPQLNSNNIQRSSNIPQSNPSSIPQTNPDNIQQPNSINIHQGHINLQQSKDKGFKHNTMDSKLQIPYTTNKKSRMNYPYSQTNSESNHQFNPSFTYHPLPQSNPYPPILSSCQSTDMNFLSWNDSTRTQTLDSIIMPSSCSDNIVSSSVKTKNVQSLTDQSLLPYIPPSSVPISDDTSNYLPSSFYSSYASSRPQTYPNTSSSTYNHNSGSALSEALSFPRNTNIFQVQNIGSNVQNGSLTNFNLSTIFPEINNKLQSSRLNVNSQDSKCSFVPQSSKMPPPLLRADYYSVGSSNPNALPGLNLLASTEVGALNTSSFPVAGPGTVFINP